MEERGRWRVVRVLFSSTPLAGHFGPMVPFVKSLARNGHAVAVAAPGALEPMVTALGADFWPLDNPAEDVIGPAFAAMREMSHEEATQWMAGEIFGRIRTEAAIPGLLHAADQWHPDVVVRETAEFAGGVVAELLSIPHCRIGIGIGRTEELFVRAAAAAVSDIRHAHGMPADPQGLQLREAPYLTLFPDGLEDQQSPAPPHALRFRDPSWRTPSIESGQQTPPFVYVTFGSVAAQLDGPSQVFTEALRAVAQLDIDVLVTIGHGMDPDRLGLLPPRIRVERWVDQASVLRTASAVLCHGGGGTVIGALAAGVPIVAVPLFAEDQHINARQIEAAGAGLRADPQHDELREALAAVLGHRHFQAAAGELARQIQTHTPTDDLDLPSALSPA